MTTNQPVREASRDGRGGGKIEGEMSHSDSFSDESMRLPLNVFSKDTFRIEIMVVFVFAAI